MGLIYLDSNIVLDFWDNRSDNIRPLGEFAFAILKRTFSCEFRILISDWILQELEKNDLDEKKLESLFNRLKNLGKLERILMTSQDVLEAKKMACLTKSHWHDCLHALLARKGGAEYLVTRNLEDFKDLDLIKAVLPEQL